MESSRNLKDSFYILNDCEEYSWSANEYTTISKAMTIVEKKLEEYDYTQQDYRLDVERGDFIHIGNVGRGRIYVTALNILEIYKTDGQEDIDTMKTQMINLRNEKLYEKKFIITQNRDVFPLYYKKDWDYEIIKAKDANSYGIAIRVTLDSQIKTTIIGYYFADEVNDILKKVIDFIYAKEDNFVFRMPLINEKPTN